MMHKTLSKKNGLLDFQRYSQLRKRINLARNTFLLQSMEMFDFLSRIFDLAGRIVDILSEFDLLLCK